jgi:endogenous inhibitor of DNA gyrase (YacG/DUF329 family)
MNQKPNVQCPMCKTPVAYGSDNFPFCSQRCQTLDLGNWASDAYIISGDTIDDEQSDTPMNRYDTHS